MKIFSFTQLTWHNYALLWGNFLGLKFNKSNLHASYAEYEDDPMRRLNEYSKTDLGSRNNFFIFQLILNSEQNKSFLKAKKVKIARRETLQNSGSV